MGTRGSRTYLGLRRYNHHLTLAENGLALLGTGFTFPVSNVYKGFELRWNAEMVWNSQSFNGHIRFVRDWFSIGCR